MWSFSYNYTYLIVVMYLIASSFLSVTFSQGVANQIVTVDNTTKLFCPELFSTSLQIECFYEGNVTSCDEPMLHDTVAKVKCKQYYYLDSLPYQELNCRNGLWDRVLFNCEPVCGIKLTKWTPFVINGIQAELGDFPWHVGLYTKKNNKHIHICGGSILSPKLIITAAHCFESLEPRRYAVAAGKIYREWKNKNDKYAQYRDVVNILIKKQYKGTSTGFAADIAILVLNQVFVLSDVIQPICIDYFSTVFNIMEVNQGNIPGWGLTSENGQRSDILQYATLPLHNFEDCIRTVPEDFIGQVTLDKVCAGYTNGTSVCEGDSGGGLTYPKMINSTELRYMLIGVVSTGPFNKGTCDSYQYTTFTTIAAHIQWVNKTKFLYETWTPYDYGCILPDYPSYGEYSIDADTPNGIIFGPGSIVPQYAKLTYSCSSGYRIHGKEIITCKEKVWNVNNFLPSCFRTCTKLNSTDLDIEYLFENVNKMDDDAILHETRALLSCKNRNYQIEEPAFNQTTCRDGQWTREVPKCKPICGVNNQTAENKYASDLFSTEYPWNVGIYVKTLNGGLQLKCAGTIVSLFVVLTGSGCINQTEISQYIIVAGSTNKTYNLLPNVHQQTTVFKKFTYKYSDIIILKKRFNATSFVSPVCFSTEILVKNNSSEIKIPYWNSDVESLKTFTYEEGIRKMHASNNNTLPINVHLGGLVLLVELSSGLCYYMVGLGTTNGFNGTGVYIFSDVDLKFIAQVLEKNNVELYEISECVVPTKRPHVRTIGFNYVQGDVVLEGTRIKYTCKNLYNLYGTKEIVCTNSTWDFPKGPPYCMGCGISRLNLDSKCSNLTQGTNCTANPNKFPWRAEIFAINNATEYYSCVGVIISEKIVITVQSCFVNINSSLRNSSTFVVKVGNFNLDRSLNRYGQEVVVDHYETVGLYWMVHMFILKTDLEISKHVLPICMDNTMSPVTLRSPFTAIMSYGDIMQDKNNNSKISFLYFNKYLRVVRVNPDKIIIFDDLAEVCSNDTYWNLNKGTPLALKLLTEYGDRYFLRGLFSYSECEYSRLYILDVIPLMDRIEEIYNKYQ